MRVRSSHFLDWHLALPPSIKGEPVAVVILVASGSCLAHFDAVDGMDLPIRGSRRSASRGAGARFVGCGDEELPRDAVRLSLEPGGHGRVGRVLLSLGVVGFDVSNLGPRGAPVVRTNLGGDAVTFLGVRL